jgi:Domain of unknown function (DUF3883)
LLTSNQAKENAAIAWVMELERQAGRHPRDTRHGGAPADIESDERIIEVKAFGKSARGEFLWLETRQVQEAAAQPDRFYVYVVENMAQDDPSLFQLKVFGGERLRRLLEGAKERHYFEVPLRVSDYDSAPSDL